MSMLARVARLGASGGLTRLRDWLSVLQVSLAVAAVALAGSASPWALALTIGLSIWAMLRALPEQLSPAASRLWTATIVLALVASGARALVFGGDLLVAGVDFLLLMVVQRLFNRQRSREHMQLLLLGAVLMVIAAVIDAELHFPVLLTLFLPSATLALLINHLIGEGERLGKRVQYEVDRYGSRELPRLGRASLQVTLIAAVAGLVTFLIFPRFGPGVFLRGNLYGEETVGFSDQVRLGGFGTIKTDATVIMHLVPLDLPDDVAPDQRRLTWHLRGSAFDRYADGSWGHSDAAQPGLISQSRGYWLLADPLEPDQPGLPVGKVVSPPYRFGGGEGRTIETREIPGFAAADETARMLVTMEDIGTDLLFAAGRPLAFSLSPRGPLESRKSLTIDVDEQVRVLDRQGGPIQYEFVGRVGEPTRAELLAIGDPEVPDELLGYLQLEDDRSPELRELAERITAGADTRIAKVEAVRDFLLDEYEYSLDQPLSDRVSSGELDPIEGFLFDTKAGHCEYFATAMALLLREVGVPTRNVNGFYGAHYNEIGEFWAVRQADAHSWVEVQFGPLGWITFDPTPPDGRTAGDDAPWFPRIAQAIDALRDAYLAYVIDFDLGKQMAILEQLGVQRDGRRFQIDWKKLAPWLGGAAGLGLILIAARRFARRRRVVEPAEVVIYRKLLRALAKRGRAKREHESARAWAQRLASEGAKEADALVAFARRYDALRFSDRGLAEAELDELRRLARAALD
ncbi:transglutaminase TgpA family protein [Nannocystaceae bacterium ST9]